MAIVISLLAFLLVLISSIWVYADAKKKIINVKGEGPLGWVFACFSSWLIFFPYYLLRRGNAVTDAWWTSGLIPAHKGKRFASDIVDLVLIPIILGILIGLVLLAAPEMVRSVVLVLVNVIWLVFRDWIFSPGRAMVKIKLVSLTGEKVNLAQAIIRNLGLIVPFILVVGYYLENGMVLAKGRRLLDHWAKTQVVEA
jgi:uncharacterized RDD family membrane protein YckC